MAHTFVGDACAFIKGGNPDGKNKYVRIGAAFLDERKQTVIKIDSLPLPGTGWTGWVNVFPRKEGEKSSKWVDPIKDDDVPF